MKILLFNKQAREKLAKGCDTLAKAVTSTLGPRSHNVAINRPYSPVVMHDGVTVARAVSLEDPFEDMGAALLREAASKTNDLAGDGTTTSTLIANTLVQGGLKLVDGGIVDGVVFPKVNPMELKERLEDYSDKILKEIDKKARKIKKVEVREIAKISSGANEIADLVTKAVEASGKDGLVLVEPAQTFESELEVQEGMEFENGFLSPLFATDTNRMITEYSDAYVLLTDYSILDGMALVPIIEKVLMENNKRALIVIAGDVQGPALQAMVLTKVKTKAPLVAVMAPEYADRRKEMLQDIAVLTGGKVFLSDRNDLVSEAKLSDLGRASIFVTQTHTLITPKNPDKEEIKQRAEAIKDQMLAEENSFKKERLQYRLAKLTQGVSIIKVGGASETEIGEKRERVIDAVHAVKAAMEDGIIPGGGVALKEISTIFNVKDPIENLVIEALQAPFNKILSNAGIEDPKLLESASIPEGTNLCNDGVDVISRQWVNMAIRGILDPAKVTKMAVVHAFSVAGMILTTDVLISDKPEGDIQKMKVIQG